MEVVQVQLSPIFNMYTIQASMLKLFSQQFYSFGRFDVGRVLRIKQIQLPLILVIIRSIKSQITYALFLVGRKPAEMYFIHVVQSRGLCKASLVGFFNFAVFSEKEYIVRVHSRHVKLLFYLSVSYMSSISLSFPRISTQYTCTSVNETNEFIYVFLSVVNEQILRLQICLSKEVQQVYFDQLNLIIVGSLEAFTSQVVSCSSKQQSKYLITKIYIIVSLEYSLFVVTSIDFENSVDLQS
eukprot:TRINITY_DN13440_c0_g1_i1.p2 TRINITY_DN13440_c0_g1~~TRINITY_DN13440_c0_g1_i1.p2  ORF type:complete len:240 (+),score=-9.90 TRINITY_DN13440_c0_g1_i1:422-1141(+)